MSFNVHAKVATPDEMEISMTLTMRTFQWRLLAEQLRKSPLVGFPAYNLVDAIEATVGKVETEASAEFSAET